MRQNQSKSRRVNARKLTLNFHNFICFANIEMQQSIFPIFYGFVGHWAHA